jgi:hypothetical protein
MTPREPNVLRNCFVCGANLEACNGFVLARDLLRLWGGETMVSNGRSLVREACARCVDGVAAAVAGLKIDPRTTSEG